MPKNKFPDVKENDIIIFKNGKIFKVSDDSEGGSSIRGQYMESDESHYLWDADPRDVEQILKSTPENLFTFTVAQSIHSRLNRFSRI